MKRKVWDITVKDNPNRVIMGENDEFYTTDTEAYLVFKLDDENFNPATAVLTLENSNDGSLKNETVDVVDGLIEWEMPQRYIEHFGNWQGQLVYEDTKDGQPELYTSAPFSFVVNAHIGDKKKPSLVEIENWEKFLREGAEILETWEDMEALREANEAQRELAESERVLNEDERILNEQARELAESERISKDSVRDSRIEAIVEDVSSKLDNKVDASELELYAKKEQEDWITPTLINGWSHGNAGTRYYKDELGRVHLQFSLEAGNGTIFILPIGYRPDTTQEFWCNSGGNAGILRVFANGNVTRLIGGGAYVLSNGVSFRAEG